MSYRTTIRVTRCLKCLGILAKLVITTRQPLVLRILFLFLEASLILRMGLAEGATTGLMAGAAKVEVTDNEALPANDPLFVKALVIRSETKTLVLLSVDAVAIGEIGPISNAFLGSVREKLKAEHQIPEGHVFVNASHCHGIVVKDIDVKAADAVRAAITTLQPVRVGYGVGHEDRIMENRRILLKDGRTVDVRHAYSLPPDDAVAEVGKIDPEIGILRLDRLDGIPLAVVYNFACHPIQGVPGGGNTADIIGYASKVIEENLGHGALALFLQGCGGDINPLDYKAVSNPRSAEPLGNRLGLSVLAAARSIRCQDDSRLAVINETITLPRVDASARIFAMESEQQRLLSSLRGTSLNLKTFMELSVKHGFAPDFPSSSSNRYLHEESVKRENLRWLDSENRKNMNAYLQNVLTMEELTRLQTNLALLKKHHASLIASGKRTIDVEIGGVRVGDFVLTSFPGELTVDIGLKLKSRSPHKPIFVAAYTNGYIYYCPTAEQMKNIGNAQEDSDCLLAPEWEAIYEQKVDSLLDRL